MTSALITMRTASAAAAALATTLLVSYASGILPDEQHQPAPVPAAETSAPRFADYVAIGDSYTSGPLIPDARLDPLGCGRSTRNYPTLLAQRIGVRTTTDVSCGGARTVDLGRVQQTVAGTNPPQFTALSPKTDLVTIGIGGNDEAVFNTLVDVCPRYRANDPDGAPCRARFTGKEDLFAAVARTGDRVRGVLRGIHGRAPRATVLLVGYPRLVPEVGTCTDVLPLADGDYRFVDEVQRALNTELAEAAAAERATYVDTYTPSREHDVCAGADEAWINGAETKKHAALRFHPFASAMSAQADLIAGVLRRMPAPPGAGELAAGPPARQGPVATDAQLDMLARSWAPR